MPSEGRQPKLPLEMSSTLRIHYIPREAVYLIVGALCCEVPRYETLSRKIEALKTDGIRRGSIFEYLILEKLGCKNIT